MAYDRKFPHNDRLEDLALLISLSNATAEEQREFDILNQLYGREMVGEKPWRDPELKKLYEEAERLALNNKALRGIGPFEFEGLYQKFFSIEEAAISGRSVRRDDRNLRSARRPTQWMPVDLEQSPESATR